MSLHRAGMAHVMVDLQNKVYMCIIWNTLLMVVKKKL